MKTRDSKQAYSFALSAVIDVGQRCEPLPFGKLNVRTGSH